MGNTAYGKKNADGTERTIALKFETKCEACGGMMPAGSRAVWDFAKKTARHMDGRCPRSLGGRVEADGVEDADMENGQAGFEEDDSPPFPHGAAIAEFHEGRRRVVVVRRGKCYEYYTRVTAPDAVRELDAARKRAGIDFDAAWN
jgi:hypothetical protein